MPPGKGVISVCPKCRTWYCGYASQGTHWQLELSFIGLPSRTMFLARMGVVACVPLDSGVVGFADVTVTCPL